MSSHQVKELIAYLSTLDGEDFVYGLIYDRTDVESMTGLEKIDSEHWLNILDKMRVDFGEGQVYDGLSEAIGEVIGEFACDECGNYDYNVIESTCQECGEEKEVL